MLSALTRNKRHQLISKFRHLSVRIALPRTEKGRSLHIQDPLVSFSCFWNLFYHCHWFWRYPLYINFLFYAVISCSHGSYFQNKKVACPTFCSVYIRRYILIHCIIMIEQVFTPLLITVKLLQGTLLLQFVPSAIKLHVLMQHIIFHSYNKSQRDVLFLKFIMIKNSTYFRQIYCPKHVEFFIKINLKNSPSLWFLL
jgi:hypothetical protein